MVNSIVTQTREGDSPTPRWILPGAEIGWLHAQSPPTPSASAQHYSAQSIRTNADADLRGSFVVVEENTGEKFSFREKLHANADFVPDLQPSAVDPHTRALADLCLALLNSNEFAYVY